MEETRHFWGGQSENDPHVEAWNCSLHILVSYWLCRSPEGVLPVRILSDSDILGKSKFTLASSFSTSIMHGDPKPDLS